ncbi:MAG: hypothetical protein LUG96_07040 [Tannerellaceae bacterium]|nr:hypothetical protein [Tannerellaceae bacterium]
MITLPVDPADLLVKDIYVVANYDNQATLNALTTLDQLNALHTPEVDKTNNLDPLNGFCMSGSLVGFDFTDDAIQPATIPLERTCVKLRISLTFPLDPLLSTTNSYLIQRAATYTYVMENVTNVLPQEDYFNFAAPLPLTYDGVQAYTDITYVYEASQAPVITLYTTVQDFTAYLPIPRRNYLYDIAMEVYEDSSLSTTRSLFSRLRTYACHYTVTTYDEQGRMVEKYTK